jgi:hypothetical protein
MVLPYVFNFNTTSDSSTFWNMTALIHAHLPGISEAGGMGYYYTIPDLSVLAAVSGGLPPIPGVESLSNVTGFDPSQWGLVAGIFLFPTIAGAATAEDVDAVMKPLTKALDHLSETTGKKIGIEGGVITPAPVDFNTMWASTTAENVGSTGVRLGSWLLGTEGLLGHDPAATDLTTQPEVSQAHLHKLASALHTAWGAGTEPGIPLIGHLIAGKGVREAWNDATRGENAVLPAWRTAYTHLVAVGAWNSQNASTELPAGERLRKRIDALKALQPSSGAYMNEADPTREDWQGEFFGRGNYEQLLAVKKCWDPQGVFWCRNCVGSEEWAVDGMQGAASVGQAIRKLCRRAL